MPFFFEDKRCHFPKGKIQLQTQYPFYEPGNTVQGIIYLEIAEPVMASHITLEIKGGEKSSFIRHWDEHVQDGDQTRVVHHADKLKASKKFLEYKGNVFDIQGGMLNPGVYSVEFATMLPEKLPSSIGFKHKKSREEPKAKIKYYVKAVLHTHDKHDEMKFKQVLIIREKPVALREGDQQSETSHIKTWCCVDQGHSTMSSVFNKNVFLPNEHCEGSIKVNNEECKLAVSSVQFFVEQRLTVKAKNHSHTYTHRLVEQAVAGPGPGVGDWQTQLALDLSKIKYEVADMKKKKGVQKKVSPEDKFMMAGV